MPPPLGAAINIIPLSTEGLSVSVPALSGGAAERPQELRGEEEQGERVSRLFLREQFGGGKGKKEKKRGKNPS